ncbi:MAG: DUF3810 domain-containing protein [Gemmatimonadales bacterium]|nr:MAG: DUF3810 domain-containing protein [Gemmatimonadales bacterium]
MNRSESMTSSPAGHPPLRLGRRLLGIGAGVLAWMLYRGLSAHPDLAERMVGQGPLAELPRLLSLVTGWIPFALAELVIGAVLLRQLVGLVRGLADVRARRDPPGRAALRGGLRLAQDAGILIALFYLLWGFQYARPGVEAALGLPERGPIPRAELAQVAEALVERTNALYLALNGEADLGVPTPAPPIRPQVPALEAGWDRSVERWNLPDRFGQRHGAPKAFLLTPIVRWVQIAGMYFPYTGEALVMGDLPGPARGKDLAHEMAHQRGIARESDANTLAYLVTALSPDLHQRYSGALFLQRQLLSELAAVDPETTVALLESRLPGVQRDVDAIRDYWLRGRGPVGEIARRANDAMLRSHGIPEGVANYRGSVWVVVALAREFGLEAVLAPTAQDPGPTPFPSADLPLPDHGSTLPPRP